MKDYFQSSDYDLDDQIKEMIKEDRFRDYKSRQMDTKDFIHFIQQRDAFIASKNDPLYDIDLSFLDNNDDSYHEILDEDEKKYRLRLEEIEEGIRQNKQAIKNFYKEGYDKFPYSSSSAFYRNIEELNFSKRIIENLILNHKSKKDIEFPPKPIEEQDKSVMRLCKGQYRTYSEPRFCYGAFN